MPILNFFPLEKPREKQVKALDFIERVLEIGYKDIIISAPTGIGKSAVGVTCGLWASTVDLENCIKGAYYLVTQKLLQDQLEHDFPHYLSAFRESGCSLKSAIEYPCPKYTTCMAGSRMPEKLRCLERAMGLCTYTVQKENFVRATVAITNYPYFFTERTYVKQLEKRAVLVADECHTLEKQILSFVDVHITRESLEEWTPFLRPMPPLPTVEEFAVWLKTKYIGHVEDKLVELTEKLVTDHANPKFQTEFSKVENHLNRVKAAVADMLAAPDNWVYWQEEKDGQLESIAKPLFAPRFVKPLLLDPAHIRIYMSAYPGPKNVFCRNLGLDPAKVARLDLNSTFHVEHRPIHLLFCGSMGRKSIDQTTPRLLRVTDKILASHAKEKGMIHCHSYKLGDVIFNYLKTTPHAPRILYPRKAEEREEAFKKHTGNGAPTVLLSPSMAEGFSLDDDLARFQIIAKMPYPSLGDKQVEAKKDIDPEWYVLQTITAIIQACGRIVRSDTDYGVTYVLDGDFATLFERHSDFFPSWFASAFKWH